MNEILKIVLSLSVSGTLLILVQLLFKPFLKERLSNRWQYYIWLVVIARLLLPFAPETNLVGTLFQEIDTRIVQSNVASLPEQDITTTPINIPKNEIKTDRQSNVDNTGPAIPAYVSSQNILTILLKNLWFIWLVLALILIIRKITVYQGFVKYIWAGCIEVADIDLLEQFGKIIEKNTIRGTVDLCTNSLVSTPLMIGFFRPCIVLPTTDLSASDFDYTIRHELTHFKRGDMFYKWLVQFTVCLHWFNPFVYIMGREINRTGELSCDEAVIRNLDTKNQRAYGDTLLHSIESGGHYKNSLASVTLNDSKELLKERLDAIMNYRKSSKLVISITLAFTILFCTGATMAGAYATNSAHVLIKADVSNEVPAKVGTRQATDYVVECVSENIIVKREGSEFKIEVEPTSQDSYTIRNNTNIPIDERNYRYNKWDIIIERKKGMDTSAVYASTMTVTIPANIEGQSLLLISSSGNINAKNLDKVNVSAESERGNIYIADTNATEISVDTEYGTINLVNATATGNILARSLGGGTVSIQLGATESKYAVKLETQPKAIVTINGQHYNGGDYTVGDGGVQTITLEGWNNTFTVSNIQLMNKNTENVMHKNGQETVSYWTADEFVSFMKEQEQQYKKLLANGDITQVEFDIYLYTNEAILKNIRNGAAVSKSSTGNIENGII